MHSIFNVCSPGYIFTRSKARAVTKQATLNDYRVRAGMPQDMPAQAATAG